MKEGPNISRRMPVLFIGHGSPLNVLMDNAFTQDLAILGTNLPQPRAILVISAHWLTRGTRILCNANPRTIYDFGIPVRELYEIAYPSPGFPELAESIVKRVGGELITCDSSWGLDHGAWTILKHIYPAADIPVLELSLDYQFNAWHPKPMEHHYELAQKLWFLREEGVLIIGSGNLVHNLRIISMDPDAPVMKWAQDADEQLKSHLLASNHSALIDYRSLGDSVVKGIPTWDHYLPMIYTLGLQEPDEHLQFFHESIQHGSISMRCFQIG